MMQAAVAAAELADLQRTVQQLQEDKQVMLRTLVATEIELQRAASKPGSARCSAEPSQQVPMHACCARPCDVGRRNEVVAGVCTYGRNTIVASCSGQPASLGQPDAAQSPPSRYMLCMSMTREVRSGDAHGMANGADVTETALQQATSRPGLAR